MRLILSILLFPLVCCGQTTLSGNLSISGNAVIGFGAAASPSATFNPTNGFGISAAYWWSPSYTIPTTNSGVLTLPNLTSLGSAYDLTNKAAQSTWPVRTVAGLNGLDYLNHNNGPYLENAAYSGTALNELFIIAALTNLTSNGAVFDADSSPNRQILYQNGSTLTIFAGANATIGDVPTNKWVVFDVVFKDSGNAFAYTNGVQTLDVASSGNGTASGIAVGTSFDKSLNERMAWVEMFVFTNANLTTLQRSNAFYYCTNRYNIAP